MIINNKLLFPSKVIKGSGKVFELQEISKQQGKGLIIHGNSFTRKPQYDQLKNNLKNCLFYTYKGGEPTLENIREVLRFIKGKDINWIAGIGGGSIIDLTKASAGLANASNDPEYYQKGGQPEKKGLPFIAIPTTAGSGAEATINAVIINEKTSEKKSIRSESFIASWIILDPELLIGCPPQVIAYSGLDAITQAIESYFSRYSSWFTENLALKGFELLIHNLEQAYLAATENKHDIYRFDPILTGSFLTGMAFTNSRLGVVHGLAHPLGSYYHQPHGLICAICLVPSLKLNKPYVKNKYKELLNIAQEDLIKKIQKLIKNLGIKNVFEGKEIIYKEEIIKYVLNSGSTKANPKDIKRNDVETLLKEIFNK